MRTDHTKLDPHNNSPVTGVVWSDREGEIDFVLLSFYFSFYICFYFTVQLTRAGGYKYQKDSV